MRNRGISPNHSADDRTPQNHAAPGGKDSRKLRPCAGSPCNRKTLTLAKPKSDDSHKNETFAELIHAPRLIRWTRLAVYDRVAPTADLFYGLSKDDAGRSSAARFPRKILFTIVRLTDQAHHAATHGINRAIRQDAPKTHPERG